MEELTAPAVEEYIQSLLSRYDEPVLLEMEREGRERNFPIVGRMVGVVLELLARSIGATTVYELGSGYGYSAYWFARAVGPDGQVYCTDGDPENAHKAESYLSRAGLWDRVEFHVGDAVTELNETEGHYDIVYCDIDKHGYPEAWQASRDRIRPGGLWICDNTLSWGGHFVPTRDGKHRDWVEGVHAMNEAVTNDPEFIGTILPIRAGVLVARRSGQS
jgi:caffeoyl-CoA O-methyltransferase